MTTKYNECLTKFAKAYGKRLGMDFSFASEDPFERGNFSLDELKEIKQAIKMPNVMHNPALIQVSQKFIKLLLKELDYNLNDYIDAAKYEEKNDELLDRFKKEVKKEVLSKFNKNDRKKLKDKAYYIID